MQFSNEITVFNRFNMGFAYFYNNFRSLCKYARNIWVNVWARARTCVVLSNRDKNTDRMTVHELFRLTMTAQLVRQLHFTFKNIYLKLITWKGDLVMRHCKWCIVITHRSPPSLSFSLPSFVIHKYAAFSFIIIALYDAFTFIWFRFFFHLNLYKMRT